MKKTALTGLMVSLALIFSYVEAVLPLGAMVPIPGFKLGISNVAVLFAVIYIGRKEAIFVLFLKATLSSLLFGTLSGLAFSLTGGLLSLGIVLLLLPLFRRSVGYLGLCIAGAACHNLGQLLAATAVLGTWTVWSYGPVLLLAALCTGVVTGVLCLTVFGQLERIGLIVPKA